MRQRRRIGVYGIATDDAGRVLLVRLAHPTGPSAWLLPGGGVEHGEDPLDALVREFAEETGLSIAIERLIDVVLEVVPHPHRQELVHFDRIIFTVKMVGGALRPEVGGSTDEVRWYTPAELRALPLLGWARACLTGESGSTDGAWPVAEADLAALIRASTSTVRDASVTEIQRFSAYGLVHDPAGRILLTRIAPGYPGAGTWHLPGGGTDFGESASVGLLRELREETGQDGVVGELLAVAHTHNPAAFGPERRSLDWHTVRSIFRVTVPAPSEPQILDEGGSTDQVAWFQPAELRRLTLNKLARTIISRYGR
jgi:ADP-ribose pyrophosphatase YjhB (NUDIX family)